MKAGNADSRTTTSRGGRVAAPAPEYRFFTLIPPGTQIDFVRLRGRMLLLTWAFILVGLVSIWYQGGIRYGIDFAGGTMVQVKFPQVTPIADIRSALDRPELHGVVVQDVGQGGQEFQIRLLGGSEAGESAVADAAKAALQAKFGEGTYEVQRVETVGPKVGRDLWRDATLAVLASTVLMGIYIAFRFDLRFGIGAAVALIHDVLFTLGALALARMEFDLTTVAALLTIVGFSVNDTVIISDRIRENVRKLRRESLPNIINLSINETLSRTIITSGTAVMTSLALLLLGGEVVRSFAFALVVGFIVGTYSSIYIAAPIVLYLGRQQTAKR